MSSEFRDRLRLTASKATGESLLGRTKVVANGFNRSVGVGSDQLIALGPFTV